ncbi:hypothetical protein [Pseudoalteromonas sp. H71]|uniref:hypothetical protein n=1 Tax=Pseudoalteromonas sp. H71 TaxID=1348395 RepID=UPI000AD811F7|nr:hypothetical protein [Pseudoalteromonas sp. H71]
MLLKSLKDSDPDQITAWMVNYLSEQILKAESGEHKANENCINIILKLWQNRSSLPNGSRPFESFEPIFNALDSLDPESAVPRYITNFYDDEEHKNTIEPSSSWLEMAKFLDATTKILITFMFEQAINEATDEKTKDWIKSIQGVVDAGEIEFFIRYYNEDEPNKHTQRIRKLEKRIEELKVFESLCAPIRKGLEEELSALNNKSDS